MKKKPLRRNITLIEVMVVVSIIAIIAALSLPNIRRAQNSSMGKTCKSNLVIIYRAKQEFMFDNPGVSISDVSQLAPYANPLIVQCPFGDAYTNVTDITIPVPTCPNNGGPREIPTALDANFNGFHDIGGQ